MTLVIAASTKAKVDAKQRVIDFITFSRYKLTNLIQESEWSANEWDVTAAFIRKGKPRYSSRLLFCQLEDRRSFARGDNLKPFHTAFQDFAKAYVRSTHSSSSITFDRLRERLYALRSIEAAFLDFGVEPNVHLLSAEVLSRAVQFATTGVSPAVGQARSMIIERIYELCLRRNMLATSFQWRHGVPTPPRVASRIGADFKKRRAEKLPSSRALEALGHIYRQPKCLRDKLFSTVCLICICSPWRASEVLQLLTDCEVWEKRREGNSEVLSYGLRAYPGKGNKPQIKWVPEIAVEQVNGAIKRLKAISAEARVIATWYVNNPHQIYLPPDLAHLRDKEWLNSAELGKIFDTHRACGRDKLADMEHRIYCGRQENRFADVERVVLKQLPFDFPYQNGLKTHKYSKAIIIVRHGALRSDTIGEGSQAMFEPIGVDRFNNWLSASHGPNVFQQYGFTEEDGSPISITTHCFRHWNNNLGHIRGLSQEDIALWSGRDPGQNKSYDHQTATEFQSDLLEMARKAGGIGPLFEAADSLPEPILITRAEFLQAQFGSAHVTEFGTCFHDYSLQPCQNQGDCVTCEENGFVKGDQLHRAEIAKLLELTEMQLCAAKTAMLEEDYGADLWVKEHERQIRRLRLFLVIHDDISIPDGTVVTLPADRKDSEIEQALRHHIHTESTGTGQAKRW